MTRRNQIQLLTFLLLPLVMPTGADAQSVLERDKVLTTITAAANRAVVAIYCMRDEWESYFGTGAVISSDGYIITSTTTVPTGIEKVYIHFTDYTVQTATVVETNEALECALLKVDRDNLFALPVSGTLPSVGDKAYTFGNADHTIRLSGLASFSAGVISGVYEVKSGDSQSTYAGLALETTAAINPGQDGGPLLNARGQIVGIISLSFSESRLQGTAIPMAQLLKGMKTFQQGKVRWVERPLVKPPAEYEAAGNPLSQQAARLAPCLVSLTVTRDLPPEQLPTISWPVYRRTIDNWNERSPQQKVRAQANSIGAEYTMNANRTLRRPDDPVTGVMISADGHILTSSFNVGTDMAFQPKRGPMRVPQFDGNLANLSTYNEAESVAVTNAVQSVTATLADGKTLPATIVAHHRRLGLTLLKVETSQATHLALETAAAQPAVGEVIGAMGIIPNRPGAFTLNEGVVSAASRNQGARFQFTALTNYGNSGGPVINAHGKLLGIVLEPLRAGHLVEAMLKMPPYPKTSGPIMGRILPLSGGDRDLSLAMWQIAPNSGIGFGAPTAMLLADLSQMAQGETITKTGIPYIGINLNLSEQTVFKDEIVVGGIEKKSPAETAGIKTGDKVVKLNDQPVSNWKEFTDALTEHNIGETVSVTVLRKGGPAYVEINGTALRSTEELHKFLGNLKPGEEFAGRKVQDASEELTLHVILGEQP